MTTETAPAEIMKLNAHGYRWHVMTHRGIVFSGRTLDSCKDYCRRHALSYTRFR